MQLAPPHARTRVVAPDGVTVAVQDWSAPVAGAAKQDVLLLHGFSQSHQSWYHQINGLAQDFRVVTYDLRGHGASDKPDDPEFYRDPQRWADEVRAVIEQTKLRRPIVVAWSYAGRIALDYLGAYGDEDLTGLVMVGATSRTEPDVLGPAAPLLRPMSDPDPAVNVPATRALLEACVAHPLTAEEMDYMLAFNLVVPPQIRANLRRPPAGYDEIMQAVRVPTLVVHGALDPVNLPAMAVHTASQIPNARVSIYDDVGHMPFWESPRRFNAEVTEFIRGAAG